MLSRLASFKLHLEEFIRTQQYSKALLAIDVALPDFPSRTFDLLAMAYDISQLMPDQSRYALYQNRYFDFAIKPGDRVLDLGSGNFPFPLATHLADIALFDDGVGRAGMPFTYVDGKSVYECSAEKTLFADNEFDFVYCSHVLEHVQDPAAACNELMRIGKRGYIECPTRGNDTFFNTAALSNHLWAVECLNGVVIFTEYSDEDKKGIESNILLDMNCFPRTMREKAVAGIDIIRPTCTNVMLLWEERFSYQIRYLQEVAENVARPKRKSCAF